MFDAAHLALAYLLLEWAIRVAMIVVIPLRRPPEAARSWLLLVLFLPVPALLLFRMIGTARFPMWRRERFDEVAPLRQGIAAALPGPDEQRQIARLARHIGGFPACDGNRMDLEDDYEAIVSAMIAAVDDARRSVHLQTYIFADDATGLRMADALARAVGRGVNVRVLVDALGSRPWAKRSMAILRGAGVDAHLTLPIRFASLRRARGDLRNHRKLCIVDGRIAFVGSLNVVDRDFKPGIVNDELVARVEGPVVAALDAVFCTDWHLETNRIPAACSIPKRCGTFTLQAVPSGPDYGALGYERLLVEMVHDARERVEIVTPYLIPDEALLVAMKNAVARGVRVTLILSKVIDQKLVRLAQRSFYDELLRSGIVILRYRDRLLHTKSVAVDGRTGIVGSSNADIRSFMLNAEISLLIPDPAATAILERVHKRYIRESDPLTLDEWRTRPRAMALLENFARLMTPLL
ncbi:MAG TPA: phospholipase D-like domain-containing protein [Novosphingobium sp.]|nr:phospholipase D-like domain-containing protein [Novosphingobium sp.]